MNFIQNVESVEMCYTYLHIVINQITHHIRGETIFLLTKTRLTRKKSTRNPDTDKKKSKGEKEAFTKTLTWPIAPPPISKPSGYSDIDDDCPLMKPGKRLVDPLPH